MPKITFMLGEISIQHIQHFFFSLGMLIFIIEYIIYYHHKNVSYNIFMFT